MIIFFGICFVLLAMATYAALSGATWVPTFKRDIDQLFKDADLKSGQSFVELGCGDGRLVLAAAKRGAVAVGYEINPLLYLVASARCWHQPHAKIVLGDLWQANIKTADIVMTFLVPRTVNRLEDKTKKEMKPGSTLVSYIFKLPNKKPIKVSHHWFIYKF